MSYEPFAILARLLSQTGEVKHTIKTTKGVTQICVQAAMSDDDIDAAIGSIPHAVGAIQHFETSTVFELTP